MMKSFARAVAVVGLVAGLSAVSAPSALANGAPSVHERGPGDAVSAQVKGSENVTQTVNDKSVTTGPITTKINGKVTDSPITTEVEGEEQDQGEKS
ncbi:MAG: hypothetical protein ACRDP3_24580 [Streptomyces sp.]|uniref:hypothetical protein n=1 Tax=Streptomyces sp. TaxID=1931 RepID=UPI003D6ACC16